MGKRSNFARMERDFYRTPYEAVVPLLPYLMPGTRFAEPCCGEMDLVRHLEKNGHVCTYAGDISKGQEALAFEAHDADVIITNPPWERSILHAVILHFSVQRPTWLLFDADWMHTRQSIPYMERCHKIVSVGRVKWFPESKMTGKDNCAWHLFHGPAATTQFIARAA